MDTEKIKNGIMKMIAHRGVSGLETENTAAAFVAAGNRGYFGIETDVHLTKDGQLVVIHDNTTVRVSGTDRIVEQATYRELAELRLYDKGTENKRSDLVIPRYSEYLHICKKYQKLAVVEMKNHLNAETVQKIAEETKAFGDLTHTIFISFDLENLILMRKLLPDQPLQYLVAAWNEELWKPMKKYRLDLDIAYPAATEDLIRRVHEKKHKINIWTVDDKAQAEQFAAWDADYLTTNRLEGSRPSIDS